MGAPQRIATGGWTGAFGLRSVNEADEDLSPGGHRYGPASDQPLHLDATWTLTVPEDGICFVSFDRYPGSDDDGSRRAWEAAIQIYRVEEGGHLTAYRGVRNSFHDSPYMALPRGTYRFSGWSKKSPPDSTRPWVQIPWKPRPRVVAGWKHRFECDMDGDGSF